LAACADVFAKLQDGVLKVGVLCDGDGEGEGIGEWNAGTDEGGECAREAGFGKIFVQGADEGQALVPVCFSFPETENRDEQQASENYFLQGISEGDDPAGGCGEWEAHFAEQGCEFWGDEGEHEEGDEDGDAEGDGGVEAGFSDFAFEGGGLLLVVCDFFEHLAEGAGLFTGVDELAGDGVKMRGDFLEALGEAVA